MYPMAITASLSYFRSPNPLLRRNVIILLAEILIYTQNSDSESLDERTLSDPVIHQDAGLEAEPIEEDEVITIDDDNANSD